MAVELRETGLVESREVVREEDLAVRVAFDLREARLRCAAAHDVDRLHRAVVREEPAVAMERMRVLEARRADGLLANVGDEDVARRLSGDLVEPRVLVGALGALVNEPGCARPLVDRDPPAVGMLTREMREAPGRPLQADAELGVLGSDDPYETAHTGWKRARGSRASNRARFHRL